MAGLLVLDVQRVEVALLRFVLHDDFAGALVGELRALGAEITQQLAEVHARGGLQAVHKHALGTLTQEDGALGVEVLAVDFDFGVGHLLGDGHGHRARRLDFVLHDTLERILGHHCAHTQQHRGRQNKCFLHSYLSIFIVSIILVMILTNNLQKVNLLCRRKKKLPCHHRYRYIMYSKFCHSKNISYLCSVKPKRQLWLIDNSRRNKNQRNILQELWARQLE